MSGLRINTIDADAVFNLPLFEHHLVIDTRCAEAFAAGSIATAVSLPAPPLEQFSDERNEALLVAFVCRLVEEGLQPENISPVVLYSDGADDSESQRFMTWLAERLGALKGSRPLQVATLYSSGSHGDSVTEEPEEYKPVLIFSERLRDYTEDIWLLAGGYASFERQYPFLCGQVAFEDLVPMPHRITPSIFMGSRPFKLTLSTDTSWLPKLGITHLIVDSDQELASQDGLAVLRCCVSDTGRQGDMGACFDASTLCISEALSQGTCVLVQVHGRSCSASLVIAWLMQTRRLTFDAALRAVMDRCWKRIDTTLIYADQLRARQLPLAIDSVPGDFP